MSRQELLAWWWSRVIEIVWMVLAAPGLGRGADLRRGGARDRGLAHAGRRDDVLGVPAHAAGAPGVADRRARRASRRNWRALTGSLDLLNEPTEFGAASPVPSAGVSLARTQTSAEADDREGVNPLCIRGEVSFRGVSFKYPNARTGCWRTSRWRCRGVHGRARRPERLGETTLCNLVARFYDPTLGAIFLDGRDVRAAPVGIPFKAVALMRVFVTAMNKEAGIPLPETSPMTKQKCSSSVKKKS